jgi:arylsulfatase
MKMLGQAARINHRSVRSPRRMSLIPWLIVIFVVVGTARLVPAQQAQEAERPNFVLIFADDLGWGDLACYGHPDADTPHLDRLAAQGTLFRQFHVSGNICPVTRAGS